MNQITKVYAELRTHFFFNSPRPGYIGLNWTEAQEEIARDSKLSYIGLNWTESQEEMVLV
jgi:hypothetical protein